jgi:dienelactone hydrolase
MLLSTVFHTWERRLAASTKDRVVRPFEWGLDWLEANPLPGGSRFAAASAAIAAAGSGSGAGSGSSARSDGPDLEAAFAAYAADAMADSSAFYAATPAPAYELDRDNYLRFESALVTPHAANNIVHARYFPAERGSKGHGAAAQARNGDGPASRAAVVVLPQWNADVNGHVGLSQLLAKFGMSALRLSLPYHDLRMPPELHRADYIVSANVGRTLQVCRQAVLDARRAVHWLAARGYTHIGILGTSLGSCLAMLTAAHEPLLKAAALNHISPFFADVVWEGLSTAHVRAGLDGHIALDRLRDLWLPISPQPHLARMRTTPTLLVYAKYDLTFPVRLSRNLVRDWGVMNLPHEVAVLPCGHYSTGVSPFKWMDGYLLTKFLRSSLC